MEHLSETRLLTKNNFHDRNRKFCYFVKEIEANFLCGVLKI